MYAELHKHHYSSGKPYWTVQCSECWTVLNSGHHYSVEGLQYAYLLRDNHNQDHH